MRRVMLSNWRVGLVLALIAGLVFVWPVYNGQAHPGCEIDYCNACLGPGPLSWELRTAGDYDDWWALHGHIECYNQFGLKLCENEDYEESYTGGHLSLTVPCYPAGSAAICFPHCWCTIVVK
jgi:hypothetical protein